MARVLAVQGVGQAVPAVRVRGRACDVRACVLTFKAAAGVDGEVARVRPPKVQVRLSRPSGFVGELAMSVPAAVFSATLTAALVEAKVGG